MNAPEAAFLDRALDIARHAAQAAAQVIDGYYRGQYRAELKSDATPVTEADVEAERAIRAVLREAFPDHAIHGEEQGRDGDGDFLWLVDPLDGTKSFVRRNPVFSTQIALMHRAELVLGVSCASQFGQMAWARRGGGAFLDGVPLQVAATADISEAVVSTGNLKSLARGPRWSALGELLIDANRGRGYGDFLHYHLLAQGSVDVVIESDVNILDIAALSVIVREAGGLFTDLHGAPLDMETRSVLAAVPALHAGVLERFKGWSHA
ncbi:inositol-phosphate phosphatase [Xanthomonadaceae bacterium JHOS43]|nr:inositol-phosphate phosphatase [Xanthomonadaceae bacterium JHOS43]MCX7562945.1 inositol-phosphate phosphatase [Xanthomonadaceae bacterium XH05]